MHGSPGEAVVVCTDDGEITIAHAAGPLSVFEPSDGRIVGVNEAWLRVYGYTREEALTMRVTDVSAEPHETSAAIARADAVGGARVDVRWHKRRDGTVFPVELTAGVFRIGERRLMFAAMHDIEAKLRSAEALRRSEASYRALLEALPDAVIVHRSGYFVYMNAAARRMLGYGLDEDLSDRPAIEIVHPDDRPAVIERVRGLLLEGRAAPTLEERLVRSDGASVSVQVQAIPTVFDGEPAVLAIARDLSARKQLEAQLVTADRLASIGRLAASVGHELNNPLAWVLGNAQLLRRTLGQHGELSDALRRELDDRVAAVEEGAVRMRDIVRDLKTLSRGESDQRVPVDVNRVLDVCANMAEHEIRHRARLVRDYGQGVVADASESRLGQVFLNLLVNAGQAIAEGDPEGNEVRVVSRADDETVTVEIHDTGVGIPSGIADRIYDPFFTTKAKSGGTGLGLPISQHIVAGLGGTISVEPRAPRGTCFRVELPRSGAPPKSGRVSRVEARVRGRVLVVEDERLLAQVLRAQLDAWDVTVAHDARSAIELLDRDRAWDAILCDVVLPDGTGLDVREHLLRSSPELEGRMVFMTGGAAGPGVEALLAKVGRPCLDKPFTPDALERALARVVLGVSPGGAGSRARP